MKKFNEFMTETLADEIKAEPKSSAAKEARKLGLNYIGFGRYADRSGKTAYIVDNDKLVPYKGRDGIISSYVTTSQQKDSKEQPKEKLETTAIKATEKRLNQDEKILYNKYKDIEKLNKALYQVYNPNMFDDNEIDAIRNYTSDGYTNINRYLYKGFDPETPQVNAGNIVANIETLDAAFDGTAAPFPYTVYTGLGQRYSPDKILAGQDYIFRGYISASIDYQVPLSLFADSGVILQIDIAKGQKSIYIEPLSDNPGEMETLLPRGSKIRVISGPHPIDPDIMQTIDNKPIVLFHCQIVEEEI